MRVEIISKLLNKKKEKKVRRENPNPILEWPVSVVSEDMGCDRGIPIDRYYIEKFLREARKYITGEVMEIGDNSYTRQFGRCINTSYVLTADRGTLDCSRSKMVYGDLQTGEGCENNFLDCFILTQTLPFIYDVKSAAINIVKMLKPGGVALITVSGISMISQYDDSRWGHYWGFSETALYKIFSDISDVKDISVISMGNPKTATGFIYGLSMQDMKKEDLESNDKLTPVTIGAIVTKKDTV